MTKFEGDQGSHVPQIILCNCIVILVFHPQSQLLSVRSGMAARRSRGLWWVKFIITSDFSLLFLVQMFNLIKSSSNAGLPPQQQLCCYIKHQNQPMHRPSGTRRTPSWTAPGTRPTPRSTTGSRRTTARRSTPSGRNSGRGASTRGGGCYARGEPGGYRLT